MFEQIIEFAGNHYILVAIFVALLGAFLVNENRLGGATLSPAELVTLINHDDALVLDVRDQKEFHEGHIVDSKHLPPSAFDSRVTEFEKHKSKPVVVVCKMGQTSGVIGKKLRVAGFERVLRLRGGIAEWRASNLPLVKK